MIEVEHLHKNFDSFTAVNDISFSIKSGEIVGLLGTNGAGKTTTMRMITGYLKPSRGTVRIDGLDIQENPVEAKKKIGYMPENASFYGDMIVSDYLNFIADIHGVDKNKRVPELAEKCALNAVMHKKIAHLSRGNKQRVGLAHALMGDPEVLILDEPTSGLDPNQVIQVRELIKKIGETKTVIISTHILSEVTMICDRVIIISNGTKVADSSTEELLVNSSENKIVKLTVQNAPAETVSAELLKVSGVEKVSVKKNEEALEIVVAVNKAAGEIRPELARFVVSKNWNLISMDMEKASLEGVFHNLTNGDY